MNHIRITVIAVLSALIVLVSQASVALALPRLHVEGHRLLAGTRAIQLRGVNFSGAEYECTSADTTTWDTPATGATVRALRSWHINAVRLPLNEDCWLGINGLPRAISVHKYRTQVHAFVTRLHRAGIYVVPNLHFGAAGSAQALDQEPMPDADHAPAFWRSVAASFHSDHGVVFDLINEPHDITWRCWRDGCTAHGYRGSGMAVLVHAIRATGARQPIMADGLQYGNDLSGWLRWRPEDPRSQLVAGWHDYNDGLGCEDPRCWSRTVARVARRFPVIAGEIGESDCAHRSVDQLMRWADDRGIGYLAWAWNTSPCRSEPALLRRLDGTPTAYGVGVRRHLLARG